jgi:hypothetical protein
VDVSAEIKSNSPRSASRAVDGTKQSEIVTFLRGLQVEPAKAASSREASAPLSSETDVLPAIATDREPSSHPLSTIRKRRFSPRTTILFAVAIMLIVPLIWALAHWTQTAILELDWPERDRVGARLEIDGEYRLVEPQGRMSFYLEPGPHRIVIQRSGYQTRSWDVELESGTESMKIDFWESFRKERSSSNR